MESSCAPGELPQGTEQSPRFCVDNSCYKATGVTETEIIDFIQEKNVPDSFKVSQSVITYAWIHLIHAAMQQKLGLTVSRCLPDSLRLLDPSATIPQRMTQLLAKTKKLVKNCKSDEDVLLKLHVPAQLLYPPSTSNIIGDECQKIGLDVSSLEREHSPPLQVTKLMVYELELYSRRKNLPRLVMRTWLSNLLGNQRFSDVCDTTLLSAIDAIVNRRRKAYHGKNTDELLKMQQEMFIISCEKMTPAEKDSHHAKLEASKINKTKRLEKAKLTETTRELKHCTTQLKRAWASEEKKAKSLNEQANEIKECKRLKKSLEKKQNLLQEKEEQLNTYCKPCNVKRREQTKLKTIAEQAKTIETQNETISHMEREITAKKDHIKTLSNLSKRRRESRDYFQQKTSVLRESAGVKNAKENEALQKDNDRLKAENKELKAQLDFLTAELEHLRDQNKPHLREENGEIAETVWECYMRLMALGVSAKNMSKVTEAVLTIICGFDISPDDLPKATSCKKVPMLANSISSYHVATEVKKTTYATGHSDGTSRDGVKVIDFEVTVDGGRTYTTGILPVASGDADTQLNTFKFMVEKLGALINKENSSREAKEIVSKIKNTMGDQAATQRSFNEKLEAYRKDIVPEVTDKWNTLEDEVKDELLSMNHFFCHLHGLIGFATYCDKGMQKLEDLWRSSHGQLGAEGLREFQDKSGRYTWKHVDSATQRLVRTACSAFASGGDQKSGAIGHFRTFLKLKGIPHNELKTFRANRFNVLFANASSVFYHRHHIKEMFEGGYIKASNKLLRAVLADITCRKLIAGIRALGILHKQFTEPYWRLIEHPNVPILKLTDQIQQSYAKLQEWSTDASPLLNKDMPPVLILESGEEIVPIRDAVFDELYKEVSAELQNATKQALEVDCCSLLVVYKRRFTDQLEGRYSEPASEALCDQTKDTLKSNKRGENDFGYWAWVAASKPQMTHLNIEGQCLYRLNRSDTYLKTLRSSDPAEYRRVMKLALRGRRSLHALYNKLSTDISLEKERRMEDHRRDQLRKKEAQNKKLAARKKAINDHGGECKTGEEVDTFLNSSKSKTERIQIAKLHIQLIKDTYELTDLPNKKELVKVTNKSAEVLARDLSFLVEYVHQRSSNVENDAPESPEYPAAELEDINHIKNQIKDQLISVGVTSRRKSQDVSARRSTDRDETRHEEPREEESDDEEEESEDDLEDESSESEDDLEDESTESEDDDAAETDGKPELKVGDIVVAAWVDTWYPGEVLQVQGTNQVIVSYMQRWQGNQNRFSWPPKNKLDIQPTEVDAIIHRDIILTPGESLRYVCIEKDMLDTLNKKYNKYYNSRIAL